MCTYFSLVECKARFTSPVFNSNQKIQLVVFFRVNCVDQIQFNKFYIRFNLSQYNQFCIIERQDLLLFEPNKIYKLCFSFLSQKQDIGKELEISSLILELGNRDARVLLLHWKGDCKNALSNENQTLLSFAKLNSNESNDLSSVDWNSIAVIPNTK